MSARAAFERLYNSPGTLLAVCLVAGVANLASAALHTNAIVAAVSYTAAGFGFGWVVALSCWYHWRPSFVPNTEEQAAIDEHIREQARKIADEIEAEMHRRGFEGRTFVGIEPTKH